MKAFACLGLISVVGLGSALPALARAVPAVPAAPPVYPLEISAPGVSDNTLDACHLTGSVIIWSDLPLKILDVTGDSLGTISAGLGQFSEGSRLSGCVPGQYSSPEGNAIDLSGQFVNIVEADGRRFDDGVFGRREAAGDALRLANGYYQLAAASDGTVVPLNRVRVPGVGSFGYQFTVILVKSGSASFDGLVYRETTSEKFAHELSREDRRLSGVAWSSVPQ